MVSAQVSFRKFEFSVGFTMEGNEIKGIKAIFLVWVECASILS